MPTNEYMREYMLRRYHERRVWAIYELGGQCADCGTIEDLEFDHIDPKDKKYDIGKVWSYSKRKFETEIRKCVLRCKPCHKIRTSGQQSVDHGDGITGKKNCYCEKCAPLKREYVRNWKRNKRKGSVS